jgi:hypothetical protein
MPPGDPLRGVGEAPQAGFVQEARDFGVFGGFFGGLVGVGVGWGGGCWCAGLAGVEHEGGDA